MTCNCTCCRQQGWHDEFTQQQLQMQRHGLPQWADEFDAQPGRQHGWAAEFQQQPPGGWAAEFDAQQRGDWSSEFRAQQVGDDMLFFLADSAPMRLMHAANAVSER